MPSFHVYGIHAFLELRELPPNPATTTPRVIESPPTLKWSPTQGMTHPISTTTVISPINSTSHPPIPFCIVVEFNPDSPCLSNRHPFPGRNYLKGDVRIEVKIDGVVRGWKVLPQAKIWPKGTRIEFSGSRIGRTEERAFVFNTLPESVKHRVHTLSAPASTSSAYVIGLPSLGDSRDPTLTPFAPSDMPLNTSHIEILITLGKKHNTLEKYLISSPVLQEAFYIPPNLISPPSEGLEGNVSTDDNGIKRKAGPSLRNKKKVAKTATLLGPSYLSTVAIDEDQSTEVGWDDTDMEMSVLEWRPVGLAGKSQKTAQMREAEFTARIHLARFWFIIAPEPRHMTTQARVPIQSTSLAPFDLQQDTKSVDNLMYNKGEFLGRSRDNLDKHGLIKSEDCDLVECGNGGKANRNMGSFGISGFLPSSLQTHEVDSKTSDQRLKINKTHLTPNTAAGAQYRGVLGFIPKTYSNPESSHNGQATWKGLETMSYAFSSLGGSTKFTSKRADSKDSDRSSREAKILKVESGLKSNQTADAQKLKTKH